MSDKSNIEWTDATWSPVIGCTKVSQGCKHCYAEREVETRWSKNPRSIWYGRRFGDVLCRPEALSGPGTPCSWKKPRRIFVCPRADIFHEAVPNDFITAVFTIMSMCPRHTFQVLTKRAERMRRYLEGNQLPGWPFPNVWLGVSVEDQTSAADRVIELLETPAAVRWISAEPLLGPIDLTRLVLPDDTGADIGGWPHCDAITAWLDAMTGEVFSAERTGDVLRGAERSFRLPKVDWVVAGGESGPHARPMIPAWAEALRDQCAAAGVPFLHKQNGEWTLAEDLPPDFALLASQWALVANADGSYKTRIEGGWGCADLSKHTVMGRVGIQKTGRLLDGVLHDAYPFEQATASSATSEEQR